MTAPTLAQVGRFELGDLLAVDQVAILDRSTGLVVLICHPYTADRWLTWAAGRAGLVGWEGVDNDYRVCRCRHLCQSHSSLLPDYTLAPGVGNGECAVRGCDCGGFSLVIAAPQPA